MDALLILVTFTILYPLGKIFGGLLKKIAAARRTNVPYTVVLLHRRSYASRVVHPLFSKLLAIVSKVWAPSQRFIHWIDCMSIDVTFKYCQGELYDEVCNGGDSFILVAPGQKMNEFLTRDAKLISEIVTRRS